MFIRIPIHCKAFENNVSVTAANILQLQYLYIVVYDIVM